MTSFSPSMLVLAFAIMSVCATTTFGLDAASAANESTSTDDTIVARKLGGVSASTQFLTGHNDARLAVGLPPLSWDPKLAVYAEEYAGQRRGDCQLVHSPGFAYGENIFWGQGRRWGVRNIVAAWVQERQWYHYDTNSCSAADCSHYTQIVWRTTERVGCAKIVCNTGDTFAVCEYDPPGNYIGQRPY